MARLLPSLRPAEIWNMPEIAVLIILDAACTRLPAGAAGPHTDDAQRRTEWTDPRTGARHIRLTGDLDAFKGLLSGRMPGF